MGPWLCPVQPPPPAAAAMVLSGLAVPATVSPEYRGERDRKGASRGRAALLRRPRPPFLRQAPHLAARRRGSSCPGVRRNTASTSQWGVPVSRAWDQGSSASHLLGSQSQETPYRAGREPGEGKHPIKGVSANHGRGGFEPSAAGEHTPRPRGRALGEGGFWGR